MIQRIDTITVSKELLEDKRISNFAKFLYITIAFEPHKKIEVRHLVKELDRSPQTINLCLRRLCYFGWLTKNGKNYEAHFKPSKPFIK